MNRHPLSLFSYLFGALLLVLSGGPTLCLLELNADAGIHHCHSTSSHICIPHVDTHGIPHTHDIHTDAGDACPGIIDTHGNISAPQQETPLFGPTTLKTGYPATSFSAPPSRANSYLSTRLTI